jgi:hypothetical protein
MEKILSGALLVVIAIACLLGSGCRTFNYTEEDMKKERENYVEGNEGPKLGGIIGWFVPR